MTLPLQEMKLVDQKTKDIVIGFIKIIENELSYGTIIPSLVITTCILFYHFPEFFTVYGDDITVNDTSTIITLTTSRFIHQASFGNVKITGNNCIYSWTIQCLEQNGYASFIGIDASNKSLINNFVPERRPELINYYAMDSRGNIHTHSHQQSQGHFRRRYEIRYCSGFDIDDTIKMNVDTINKTIEYYVNDEYQGVAFKNIEIENPEIEYYLVVHMGSSHYADDSSFEIVDFTRIYL